MHNIMAAPTPTRAAIRCLRTRPLTYTQPTCRRSFHSYEHPSSPGPFGKTETAILEAAYKHVPEHGFTHRALSLGARDAGLLDISASALPEGPFGLIRYHLLTSREALAARSQDLFEKEDAPRGVGGKVRALTWERLMANRDVIHRWQEVRLKMENLVGKH